MIPEVLEKMLHTWRNLSVREQRLAMLTALVLGVMVPFFVYKQADEQIRSLDREITRLENELLSFTREISRQEIIEAQYATIAAQHSSEWTEAEIHDRLRQEIYRLAKNNPPPLDKDGIPLAVGGDGGNLVDISLGKGQMSEGGRGYREYRINLRISPTPLRNIIEFLERLHNSPQALRIDALDLNRPPESELVASSIDISRIVADGAPVRPDAATVREDDVGRVQLRADAWHSSGATVQDLEDARQNIPAAVSIHTIAAAADVYMTRSLPGGAEYEMIADITSSSWEVKMGVGLGDDGTLLTPMQRLAGDGAEHRYQVQFAVPGDGAPATVRFPWIQAGEPDAVVQVSGLLLRTVSEMYR